MKQNQATILNSLPEAIIISDQNNNNIEFANNQFLTLFQYTKTEISKIRLNKLFTTNLNATIEKKAINQICNKKDGSIFYADLNSQYLNYKNKSCIITSITDIHEKFLLEKSLNESEERFKTLYSEIPVSIIIHDKDTGEIIDANQMAYKSYGFQSVEEFKKNDFWLEKPYSSTEALNHIKKAAKHGLQEFEWLSRRKNKELFWEHVKLVPVKIKDQIRIMAVAIDITQRIKIENEHWKKEQKLKTLIQTIPDLIFHFNKNGKFLDFYQPTKSDKLLKQPSEFVNKTIYDIFENDFAQKTQEAINQTITNGKYEMEYNLNDGETHYYYAKFAKLNESEVLSITSDITAIKKAEIELRTLSNELKQINTDKDLLLQILAHDLRNSFSSVIGYADILLSDFRNNDLSKVEKQINKIINATHKSLNLLENLLLWSKSQSGKLPYTPEDANLHIISCEIIFEFFHLAVKKNIRLLNFITEPFHIKTDRNMLRTVLRNLTSNAIKFTPNGGQVSIELNKYPEFIEISVADNGIGIAKEIQDKILSSSQPFSTEGTDYEYGTGMGFIICKDFIKKMNGKISINSKIGEGSRFIFTLPL